MGIYAEGFLVGYLVDKNNQYNKKTGLTVEFTKYFYYVLLYDLKNENGLYNRVNLITVVTSTPSIPVLKPQPVIVEMELSDYISSKTRVHFTKIRPKDSNV